MKALKTVALIALITSLGVTNSYAWGKKHQGVLIGAAAAVLLPQILRGNTYKEPTSYYVDQPVQYVQPAPRYVEQPVQYVQRVEQPQPTIIYVEKNDSGFSHRRAKTHNYINSNDGDDKVIIEHKDGSRTIIYR